jgi:tetratricopeptide (TPR) repeat protein
MSWKPTLSRLLWPLCLIALGLLGAAVVLVVRSRSQAAAPTWQQIQQAAEAKRWGPLESMLERWLDAHPRHGEGLVQLAAIRLMRDRRADAITLLEAVPESSLLWGQAQVTLAELLINERRAAEAETVCRRHASRDPQALLPRQRLIYLLSLQQRADEVRDLLWQVERIQDDPRVLVDLVLELLLDQQDVRGFAPELEEFVNQTPEDPFLRRAWGLALLYQGKAAEAKGHLEAAAGSLVNDPIGRFALAECEILLGNSPRAEGVLGPRPELPADEAAWWVFRGRLYEALGNPDSAAAAFQQALDHQPDGREAHFRLGQLLERLGRVTEGRKHLAAAQSQADRLLAVRREHERVRKGGLPKDPALYQKLGQLCQDAGQIREARAWFDWALRLDPNRSEVRARLSDLSRLPDSEPVALARPVKKAASFGRPRERQSDTGPSDLAPPAQVDRRSEKVAENRTPLRFEDVTQRAGVCYQYESGASDRLFLADTMGGGVGLFDYDGDGWLDIYFVNGCSIPWDKKNQPRPNRLYRNMGDGTFRDVTAKAGVAGVGYGMGCAVGDFDNDGYDDLFVTGLNRTILYHNRGDGTFEDVTARAGVASDRWTTAAGFGDLDCDGDLDLVVIAYVEIALDDVLACRDYAGQRIHCTPARYPAQLDLLFRNNGDGTFTEVSHRAGFEAEGGRGLGLAIADLDEDGKLDIFVANDASPNFLFRNSGALKFEEKGAAAGVATNGSGRATASMGVVAQDLDGDGRIDLFFTNLVNESSTFFRNLGQGFFCDATLGAGLDAPSRPKTGFGDAALDVDNDGLLDLFVANGHVDDRPWANSKMAQAPLLFRGRGLGRFEVVRAESPSSYLARTVVGRGVACGDLNNDGRLDLVVVHHDAPAALLKNQTPAGHYLGVRLRGTRSGRTPIGARVSCRTRSASATRCLTSGSGYLSAHDPRLWFGLGEAVQVESLEVTWPSGRVQSWRNLDVDRIVEIEEGQAEIRELGVGGKRRSDPGAVSGIAPR